MKIDVCQKQRCTAALGRLFSHTSSLPILQHAGIQPFLDEPYDAPICDPMLDEFHKPFVGEPIEKVANIKIEHPVHFSRQQSRVDRIQRLMLAVPGPERIGKTEKVRFVDAFITSTAARWTILSPSAVTLSGLCRPSAFRTYTLRTGFARYAPRFSLSERSWRFISNSSPATNPTEWRLRNSHLVEAWVSVKHKKG
jgi:hypothetical protein